MKYQYRTQGTCSQLIEIEVENGVVKDLSFIGGCNGNLKGIAALVKGMKVEDLAAKLEGITCGSKATSCPDQLAKALRQILLQADCEGNCEGNDA